MLGVASLSDISLRSIWVYCSEIIGGFMLSVYTSFLVSVDRLAAANNTYRWTLIDRSISLREGDNEGWSER